MIAISLSTQPLLPMLNLAVAACVLAYWAHKWYGYLTRDITWYASDQAIPLTRLPSRSHPDLSSAAGSMVGWPTEFSGSCSASTRSCSPARRST